MLLSSQFKILADYNLQMNVAIYAATAMLDDAQLKEDRGAFFKSVIGTLNHILVGDIVWLKRFADHPAKLVSLELMHSIEKPAGLDSILYGNLNELKSVRFDIDNVIKDFAGELNDEVLGTTLTHRNMKGEPFCKNFGHLILHLFNHQTHHRGQLSTLLNQFGIDIGVTDLLYSIPDKSL